MRVRVHDKEGEMYVHHGDLQAWLRQQALDQRDAHGELAARRIADEVTLWPYKRV